MSLVNTTRARYSQLIWCTIPVPGGTTLKSAKACWPQRRNAYRSRLRSNSSSTLRTKASGRPAMSATTEWSMTSSAGASGLIRAGSPPRVPMASRIAARSTIAGTPVKSCISTLAGENAISRSSAAAGSQRANASTSSAVTALPSSFRSRFSSSTFSENGSPPTSPTDPSASSRKTSNDRSPTSNPALAPKLFPAMVPALHLSRVVALCRVPGDRPVQAATSSSARTIRGDGPRPGRRLDQGYRRAWEQANTPAVLGLFTEDATYRSYPLRAPHTGHDGIAAYWTKACADQQDVQAHFGDPIVDGDRVAVEWWTTMRAGATRSPWSDACS